MASVAEIMYSQRSRQLPQTQEDATAAQLEWVKSTRRQFGPADMLTPGGDINQDFFKPEKIVVLDDKKWGTEERELLYKGLEKYGIGKWREIGTELLPRWDDQALRIKASRLMGSQSLARYVGWKGNKDAVEAEFKFNKEIGEKTGCWKSGALVEDNNGSVKRALEEMGIKT